MSKPHHPVLTVAARRTALALGAVLLLAGCAALPGQTPARVHALDAPALGLHTAASDVFPHDAWWQAWGDPELDRLQQQLAAANPDLQLAAARLRQAQAAASQTGAALWPHAGAGLQSTRQLYSANDLFVGTPLAGAIANESQLSVQAGWQLDFFGRNRAALEAAQGRAAAVAAQAQAARVLLSSALAARYLQLAGELAQGRVLQTLQADQSQLQQLAAARAAAGLEPLIPQRQAQLQLAQIAQQIERNQLAVAQSRHALAALLGEGPQATAALAPRLPPAAQMRLPDQLPAQLLGRRADIVAARWQVEAALAGVKQARAAYYPDINLSLFAGYAALGWSNLTRASSQTWGVGPAISLPLFEGGALDAQLHGARAGADAAIAQYNATVVGAVREVADAIDLQRAVDAQLAQQQQAVRHADAVSAMVGDRVDAGLGNRQALLQARIGAAEQQLQRIALQAAAWRADIGLIQALGGGYASPRS